MGGPGRHVGGSASLAWDTMICCEGQAATLGLDRILSQSCPRRARRGQEQARFAARYAGYESDAP
jgi:hypothetical protein